MVLFIFFVAFGNKKRSRRPLESLFFDVGESVTEGTKLLRNAVRIQTPLRNGCGKSNKPSDEVLFQEILLGLQPRVHTCLPDSRAPQGKSSGTCMLDRKR